MLGRQKGTLSATKKPCSQHHVVEMFHVSWQIVNGWQWCDQKSGTFRSLNLRFHLNLGESMHWFGHYKKSKRSMHLVVIIQSAQDAFWQVNQSTNASWWFQPNLKKYSSKWIKPGSSPHIGVKIHEINTCLKRNHPECHDDHDEWVHLYSSLPQLQATF